MSILQYHGQNVIAGGSLVVKDTNIYSNVNYGRLVSPRTVYDKEQAGGEMFPTDWTLPSKTDFETFGTFISNDSGKIKEVGSIYWDANNIGSTNETEFSAKGAGYYYNSSYGSFKARTNYLTSTWYGASPSSGTWYVGDIFSNNQTFAVFTFNEYIMSSIRLIWSGSGDPEPSVIDYDNNIYNVIQIGTQYWLKQNWASTKWEDGTSLNGTNPNGNINNVLI